MLHILDKSYTFNCNVVITVFFNHVESTDVVHRFGSV